MKIGILTIKIFIPDSQSLKQKRMILKSLKTRLRNSFNISLLEVADHDKWQKTMLALAAIGISQAKIDACFSNIVDSLEMDKKIQLIDYKMEIY